MAVAKTKAAAPRTQLRPEPEARVPERAPRGDQILTRDGRAVNLDAIKNKNTHDYTNLAALGIFPPQGWVYEWRTRMVKNAEWRQAIVEDEERGWTPVPADRHDGKIMPRGFAGPIESNGQMLMERDARLTAMSRAVDQKAANAQLAISRSTQGLMQRANPESRAIDVIADFNHNDARGANFVRGERQPRVSDSKYEYGLDE